MSVLYPQRCPVCDTLTGKRSVACCPSCEKKLPYIRGARCFQCGKPVASGEEEYCMDCQNRQHDFTQGISLWSYDADIRQAMYRFKYRNRREYAVYFARELIRRNGNMMTDWHTQAIIPVPIHKTRRKQRGFNQAELLAKELGRYLDLPVLTETVVRIRNTKPQKELNDKDRQKNLKSAFKINKNSVKLKKVILVDDIYTTGATVDVIARLLKRQGVVEIYVVTVCIGRGY